MSVLNESPSRLWTSRYIHHPSPVSSMTYINLAPSTSRGREGKQQRKKGRGEAIPASPTPPYEDVVLRRAGGEERREEERKRRTARRLMQLHGGKPRSGRG